MMRKKLFMFITILICLMPLQTLAQDSAATGYTDLVDDTAAAVTGNTDQTEDSAATGYTDQADNITLGMIMQVQEALNSAGYNCGTADGLAGQKTKSAIEQYKKDKQLSETSEEITDELLVSLRIKMDERDQYLHNVAKSLDPGIILQTGETDLKMERRYDGDGADHIREFIRAACCMLKAVAEDGRYSSMTAAFNADNSFEVILFSNIEGNNEFTTAYYGPMSADENVKLAFPDAYKKVFGAHDKTIRSENELKESGDEAKAADKKLREDYRNGWYWALCNFDPKECFISIGDDIELQIPADNTVEDGWNACSRLTEAVDMLNYICNTDPLSMPYSKLTVNYFDRADGTTSLNTFTTEESGDAGAAESQTADNPFAAGFAAFKKGMTPEEAEQAYLISMQNAALASTQNTAQDPALDLTQNTVQDSAQSTGQESAQNSVQNTAQGSAQDSSQDTAQESAQDSKLDTTQNGGHPGDGISAENILNNDMSSESTPENSISEDTISPEPVEPQLLSPVPPASEADSQQLSPSQTLSQ